MYYHIHSSLLSFLFVWFRFVSVLCANVVLVSSFLLSFCSPFPWIHIARRNNNNNNNNNKSVSH